MLSLFYSSAALRYASIARIPYVISLVGLSRWPQPRTSERRDVFLVVLMGAFELEEIVVSTRTAVRISAAYIGASLIHGALPRLPVKKTAHGPINLILVMSQDLLIDVARLVPVGKSLARGRFRNSCVSGEPSEVVIGHCDSWMTAAITGALLTIELHLRSYLVVLVYFSVGSLSHTFLRTVSVPWLPLRTVKMSRPPSRVTVWA